MIKPPKLGLLKSVACANKPRTTCQLHVWIECVETQVPDVWKF